MNSKEIANFRQLGDMILPRLLDANYLRNIDDYGDYALLTYNLAEPVPIQTALDDMEDNMDLNVLYHVEVISAAKLQRIVDTSNDTRDYTGNRTGLMPVVCPSHMSKSIWSVDNRGEEIPS